MKSYNVMLNLRSYIKLYMFLCTDNSLNYIGRWGFEHIAQCGEYVTNGSNHWISRHLTRSVKLKPWPGGHEVLFTATSDRLPSLPTKDERATDSCFTLIGAHQCGIPMVDVGRPAASKSTQSETLVVSIETSRGQDMTEHSMG